MGVESIYQMNLELLILATQILARQKSETNKDATVKEIIDVAEELSRFIYR